MSGYVFNFDKFRKRVVEIKKNKKLKWGELAKMLNVSRNMVWRVFVVNKDSPYYTLPGDKVKDGFKKAFPEESLDIFYEKIQN